MYARYHNAPFEEFLAVFYIIEKATRISFEKPQFTCKTHDVCQGYTLLVYPAFLWPVFKIVFGIVLSNSFLLPLH